MDGRGQGDKVDGHAQAEQGADGRLEQRAEGRAAGVYYEHARLLCRRVEQQRIPQRSREHCGLDGRADELAHLAEPGRRQPRP
eukprot:scaffold34552_cov90-Isochrysis_galbana.AAC.3